MPGNAAFQDEKARLTDWAIGVQLQNLRIFARLTADQAAVRLCIAKDALDRIESGSSRPASPLLLAMASLYGIAPSRVFAVARPT